MSNIKCMLKTIGKDISCCYKPVAFTLGVGWGCGWLYCMQKWWPDPSVLEVVCGVLLFFSPPILFFIGIYITKVYYRCSK